MPRTKKESNQSESIKKKYNKKGNELSSGLGLFDHIKHIKSVQDPDYFKSLNEFDLKSFNHFMILKSLSMNPKILEQVSFLFKYFDTIPSPQFYKLLIGIIPLDSKFYPWIKSSKKPLNQNLVSLISQYFEISKKEAEEYISLLISTEKGFKELQTFCVDAGLNEKEIKEILSENQNVEEG